jgi:hypothetical protein
MEKPTHNILQKMGVLYNPGKQNNILNKHYSIILCRETIPIHYTNTIVSYYVREQNANIIQKMQYFNISRNNTKRLF